MNINEAVTKVEAFLEQYKAEHDDWRPAEIRVLPSGDDADHIKLWFNFGPDFEDEDLATLKQAPMDALAKALPEVDDEFKFEIRAVSI